MQTPTISRVLFDLVDEEVGKMRGRSLRTEATYDNRDPALFSLGQEGGNLDSLEMLTAAGRANEFFRLHEIGVEDLLLSKYRIEDWVQIISRGISEGTTGITFTTSGSTSEPKHIYHSWESLEQEIEFWMEYFNGGGFGEVSSGDAQHRPKAFGTSEKELRQSPASPRRVISTVPAHHIYGFLFTALLPQGLEIPMRKYEWEELGQLRGTLQPGDLIVSHPELWTYLKRSIGTWPPEVLGVSSTAALPPEVHKELRKMGLTELTEVYGSTETGGIGVRTNPDAHFVLMPYFQRRGKEQVSDAKGVPPTADLMRRLPSGREGEVNLQDRLEWTDERRFYPRGRVDRVVQIGGENVDMAHVEAALSGLPGVSRVIVRPFTASGSTRLKAFVVVDEADPEKPDKEMVISHARARLRPVARPVSVTIGSQPPINAMGKLADWQEEERVE